MKPVEEAVAVNIWEMVVKRGWRQGKRRLGWRCESARSEIPAVKFAQVECFLVVGSPTERGGFP
jgi:hypothetical protein